nr:MAG TPA: hypothetical protein [Caudoviricetes sp.]
MNECQASPSCGAFLFAVRRTQNPLPGTLRPESRHCLTLIFLACRQVFYSRPQTINSRCHVANVSDGLSPTTTQHPGTGGVECNV